MIIRLRNFLRNSRVKRVHIAHRKTNADEYLRIDKIINSYHMAGGLRHEYQAYKLYSLIKLLESKLPESILELGTGSTTPIFVDYVRQLSSRTLTCVDESEHWLNNSRRMANIDDRHDNVQLICSPSKFYFKKDEVEAKYEVELKGHYDFVFIDGPSAMHNGVKYGNAVFSNIFDIAQMNLPKTIVVDIRVATVNEIARKLGKYYRCLYSDVKWGNMRNDYNYFTIFSLISNE